MQRSAEPAAGRAATSFTEGHCLLPCASPHLLCCPPQQPLPPGAPFMSRRVTVTGCSWPMRWLRPMACRAKLGLRVGSHRLGAGARGVQWAVEWSWNRTQQPCQGPLTNCVEPSTAALARTAHGLHARKACPQLAALLSHDVCARRERDARAARPAAGARGGMRSLHCRTTHPASAGECTGGAWLQRGPAAAPSNPGPHPPVRDEEDAGGGIGLEGSDCLAACRCAPGRASERGGRSAGLLWQPGQSGFTICPPTGIAAWELWHPLVLLLPMRPNFAARPCPSIHAGPCYSTHPRCRRQSGPGSAARCRAASS